ncbi:hypothetical protein AOLI_G00092510 [Acnodon oligacanthus]
MLLRRPCRATAGRVDGEAGAAPLKKRMAFDVREKLKPEITTLQKNRPILLETGPRRHVELPAGGASSVGEVLHPP